MPPDLVFKLEKQDIPPAFLQYTQANGTLSQFHLNAITHLLFAPDYYEQLIDSGPRRNGPESKILYALPEHKRQFLTNKASVSSWTNEVKRYLVSLNELLAQGNNIRDSVALDDVVLMDILAVTANERARFEAEGVSKIYDPSDADPLRTKVEKRPLNLKRFHFTDECIDHIRAVQDHFLNNREQMAQSMVRERAIFMLTKGPNMTVEGLIAGPHHVGVELVTKMHQGVPWTVILCVDSLVSTTTAEELKAKLDIQDVTNATVLVVNAKAQKSEVDCPIYSLFHVEKYKAAELDGTFDQLLSGLFDNTTPTGSYRLRWGRPDGAQVFHIEDDNSPGNRILPPFILKEIQGRSDLKKMVSARNWETQTVNKKGQTFQQRYASHYRETSEGHGRPMSIAEKRIKYFERALELLEKIQAQYEPDAAQDLLKRLLIQVRTPGVQAVPAEDRSGLRVEDRIQTIRCHIEQSRQRVELLQVQSEFEEAAHQQYLLDKSYPTEDSDNEEEDGFSSDDDNHLSEADRIQLKKYMDMDQDELNKIEKQLSKKTRSLQTKLRSLQEQYGISMATLENENVTLAEETMRLNALNRSLTGLGAMQRDFVRG